MGALRVQCPLCRVDFPVPADVIETNQDTHLVTVVLDRTELYGHLQQCAARVGAPPPSPTKVVVLRGSGADVPPQYTKAELAGRVHRFLAMGAFLSRAGSRACTMCGVPGAECLEQLSETPMISGHPVKPACCNACRDGNTHPAPKDGESCAVWAETHGCKS